MTDYTWRTVGANERQAPNLERACLEADGRYAIPLFETAIRGPIKAWGIGAEYDGQLVAFAWLAEPVTRPPQQRHDLWLYVHPQHRTGQALEKHILQWAEKTARERRAVAIHVRSEANTPELDALYRQAGYECRLQETVMVYDLRQPLPQIPLPEMLERATWSRESALQFHLAHVAAFTERPGYKPLEFEDWVEQVQEDDDFRADWSTVALENDFGQGVGYVRCNYPTAPNLWGERGGWITQVGTHPKWRRRGIAAALIVEAMQKMVAENLDYAILHVNVNNPGAQKVYTQIGFQVVGQRGRYMRTITPTRVPKST